MSMEYRKLPRGEELISTLGLGFGGIQNASSEEIERVVVTAVNNGINFFDMCAGGKSVYEPFGKGIKGIRDKIYFQLHFGAVYNSRGDYAWSRDLDEIKSTIEYELKAMDTDYIDFGYLHCVDDQEDLDGLVSGGVLDFICKLHAEGTVRHIGFSSHTPSVAEKILDMGIADMFMLSVNPAYDYECGDEYGVGTVSERARLFRRAEKEGVGISVMKPFHGGQLLDAKTSPFKAALTKNQCLSYVLDRPGVLTAVPGVRGEEDLAELLKFLTATKEEKDYSVIGGFDKETVFGNCVYCNHCQPCPVGIDIGLVNKYYDLAKIGDNLAYNHYKKLATDASACIKCGHCDSRCPFKVNQSARMAEIADYFN